MRNHSIAANRACNDTLAKLVAELLIAYGMMRSLPRRGIYRGEPARKAKQP
jgi:hypothetical protein